MGAKSILFLLLTGWQLRGVTGVRITPCGEENVLELKSGQKHSLTCTSDTGIVDWRLVSGKGGPEQQIAKWENDNLRTINDFENTFVAKTKSLLEINAVNNRKIYEDVSFVNGTLLCKTGRETATCGLNYVYPAEGIACTAVRTSWTVTISCNISSAYSSRRIYTCQLLREEPDSELTPLQNIAMTTSSNNQLMAKNEFKVSGYCLLSTQLPAVEGTFVYEVYTWPGRRRQKVDITADKQSLTVKRPAPPNAACHPVGHVLENTDVTCVCRTTSLGQPEGSLRWMVGDGTNGTALAPTEWNDENPLERRYNRTLTMSDHGRTWLRCEVLWGTEDLRGDIYMANVGRKPRSLSSDNVLAMTNMQFDVIAFPKPHNATLLYLGTSPSTNIIHLDSKLSIISLDCNSYPNDLDQFHCTLVPSANSSEMPSGFYRLVVVNEVGEGIFTVRTGSDEPNDGKSGSSTAVIIGAAVGSVVAVVVIIVIVIVVIRRRRADPTYASPKRMPAAGEEHEYMDLHEGTGRQNRAADVSSKPGEQDVQRKLDENSTYASPKTRPAPGEEHEYMDLHEGTGRQNRAAGVQRKLDEGAYEVPVFPPS